VHEARRLPSTPTHEFNRKRFLSLDLLFGRPCAPELRAWLLANGMTAQEYTWFMTSRRSGRHVLGIDYYGRNEHVLTPSGRRVHVEDVLGLYAKGREYHSRYGKPSCTPRRMPC
jgi:beta-glucosidase